MSEPLEMDDVAGDSIAFEVTDDHVCIVFTTDEGTATMGLSPAKQEEFAQLYVAACHQAKANGEVPGRAAMPGQVTS